jgi:hypothetical protein
MCRGRVYLLGLRNRIVDLRGWKSLYRGNVFDFEGGRGRMLDLLGGLLLVVNMEPLLMRSDGKYPFCRVEDCAFAFDYSDDAVVNVI